MMSVCKLSVYIQMWVCVYEAIFVNCVFFFDIVQYNSVNLLSHLLLKLTFTFITYYYI